MTDIELPPADAEVRSRLRVADVVCGAGIGLGIVATYVFLVLSPSMLVHHGVLLEALNGSNAAIVGGGAYARTGRDSLALVILAPLCTIAIYDVFFWWAGRLWGSKVAEFYTKNNPRAARWIDRGERIVRRRGVLALAVAYYLPFPNVVIYLSCGVSGMALTTFVIGDVIGTLLWEALLIGLGWAIGQPAVRVIHQIGHYSLIVTVAIVIVVVALSAWRRRRAAP
jgi:membrane-associated protein